ncbi:hypothetical protein M0R88_05960 [Halorussus gelatinilyticus]|uniref:Uncharacterized protein n=1 Tax=Halorussus gelatinilyticus TaxID=2937524 RepID=A0A8U0IN88_9EURY|nr:hypothetical protein [Halorussus gelatinilyticus]UPW01644.1 hypothetical protein M0R88_05960 [Halorussus gelatinilyticus]
MSDTLSFTLSGGDIKTLVDEVEEDTGADRSTVRGVVADKLGMPLWALEATLNEGDAA